MSKVVQVQKFYFPEEVWQFVKEYMGVDGGIPVLLSKRLWQLQKDDLYMIIQSKLFIKNVEYGYKKKSLVRKIIMHCIKPYSFTKRTIKDTKYWSDMILETANDVIKINNSNKKFDKMNKLINN
jgi:hypothetical protein